MREGKIVILELVLDVEFVELVIYRIVWFFCHRKERIVGVLKALLLFFLLFEQFFELNRNWLTSSLSALSTFSLFIY